LTKVLKELAVERAGNFLHYHRRRRHRYSLNVVVERTAKIFSSYLGKLMTLNEQRAENPLFQGLHLPNPNISRSHNMYSYVYEY
jgi:hypothetical protein